MAQDVLYLKRYTNANLEDKACNVFRPRSGRGNDRRLLPWAGAAASANEARAHAATAEERHV
jgi:hypothetical protein